MSDYLSGYRAKDLQWLEQVQGRMKGRQATPAPQMPQRPDPLLWVHGLPLPDGPVMSSFDTMVDYDVMLRDALGRAWNERRMYYGENLQRAIASDIPLSVMTTWYVAPRRLGSVSLPDMHFIGMNNFLAQMRIPKRIVYAMPCLRDMAGQRTPEGWSIEIRPYVPPQRERA